MKMCLNVLFVNCREMFEGKFQRWMKLGAKIEKMLYCKSQIDLQLWGYVNLLKAYFEDHASNTV